MISRAAGLIVPVGLALLLVTGCPDGSGGPPSDPSGGRGIGDGPIAPPPPADGTFRATHVIREGATPGPGGPFEESFALVYRGERSIYRPFVQAREGDSVLWPAADGRLVRLAVDDENALHALNLYVDGVADPEGRLRTTATFRLERADGNAWSFRIEAGGAATEGSVALPEGSGEVAGRWLTATEGQLELEGIEAGGRVVLGAVILGDAPAGAIESWPSLTEQVNAAEAAIIVGVRLEDE